MATDTAKVAAKLAALEPVAIEGTPLPRFLGGAVGMVSYD